MVDLKLQVAANNSVKVDTETPAAMDRRIKNADEERTISIDRVRKIIPEWEREVRAALKRRLQYPS